MKLSIIIPAYNEEKTIVVLLEKVFALKLFWQKKEIEKEIIVVDDGSGDQTLVLLEKLREKHDFILIKNKGNRGKGQAISIALKKTSGNAILTQDADLEYDPEDIQKLLDAYDPTHSPAVWGSRNLKKKNRGYLLFFWGGKAITFLTNFACKCRLTDVNTGYKLFSKEILQKIDLQEKGFSFCEEITIKILCLGVKIVEVPISYNPRKFSEGKKISILDGLNSLTAVFKYSKKIKKAKKN